MPPGVLQATHAWSDAEWSAGIGRVTERGWLEADEPTTVTAAGRAHRQEIEDQTDQLAVGAYAVLGDDDCARLRSDARPLSIVVTDAGLMRSRSLPDEDLSTAGRAAAD